MQPPPYSMTRDELEGMIARVYQRMEATQWASMNELDNLILLTSFIANLRMIRMRCEKLMLLVNH